MRWLFRVVLSFVFVVPALAAAVEGDSVAQRMVALSLKQELAEGDARVVAVARQLQTAMKATGETEQAIAAACTRAARFLFDATKAPVTSLDVLDGVLAQKQRAPLNEAIGRYVEARRNSVGKTHAEALSALK